MPGSGDQHVGAKTPLNPFEEVKPHISEYTAKEIATLSSRLEKQLGPEYISSRPGASGQKVHYLAADKCINLANDVFGFNGWSSGIQNIQIDFVDENQSTGKVSLGLSVIVRVTLRDGTYHEDIGYGHIENCKGKAAAFEKAKKEGTTDGLKRALRNFGNMLGNCIYDKDYVAKVTKLKITPSKWDPDNLHRHPDYAPIKKDRVSSHLKQSNSTEIKTEPLAGIDDSRYNNASNIASFEDVEDEFGSDGFEEADFSVAPHQEHPDEVTMDSSTSSEELQRPSTCLRKGQMPGHEVAHDRIAQQMKPPVQVHSESAPKLQALPRMRNPDHTTFTRPIETTSKSIHCQRQSEENASRQQVRTETDRQSLLHLQAPCHSSRDTKGAAQAAPSSPQKEGNSQPTDTVQSNTPPFVFSGSAEHDHPIGFFTARAAESVQNVAGTSLKAPAFNPHLESPSIRKTAGVDHTKTKPVGKEVVAASPVAIPPRSNSNFVNPQADRARRVGMPVGVASPLQNRSSYRPPQIKRPAEMNVVQNNLRPALGDVTSATVNVPSETGGDLKRQKVGTTGFVANGTAQAATN